MKNLIRTILKETVDNRIVDILIKLKLPNVREIHGVLKEIGYDYQEIEEIYVEYFETISGMDLTPMNWMNYYFNPNQLQELNSYDINMDHIESTLYKKNGVIVMGDDLRTDHFWFDYKIIWSPLDDIFDLGYDGVHKLLREWLTKNMGKEWYTIEQTNLN